MRQHEDLARALARITALEARIALIERRQQWRGRALPETLDIVVKLMGEAAALFDVATWEIEGTGRTALVNRARQWVMFEARACGLSFPQIGAAMGRDHSTVKSGCMEERLRRGKRLPDNENSTKMRAGRNAVDAAPDPDRNRDLNGGAQHG